MISLIICEAGITGDLSKWIMGYVIFALIIFGLIISLLSGFSKILYEGI